ncbi:hypothetical protein [Streptomyces sp. TP-A0356]|uniref:hypothetical protein n=1 Tax=Streptomyces sp. TP-A0356 TaxID=1359208 RepID=UPI0006E3B163|nr:hypothetical protein [Streptomyces sp. TP-A0356]
MSTGTLLAIVIPIAFIVALIALALALLTRRRTLRERFGPEYERTVEGADDSQFAAERELSERAKRHDHLDIKPFSASARDRFTRDWDSVQQEFVGPPENAVHDADRLVTSLMQARGYHTEGFDRQLKDLSVEHGRTLEHYRAAHESDTLSTGHKATAEQLRNAMVH